MKPIIAYIENFAKINGLKYEKNPIGNIIIYKTNNQTSKEAIALQAHLDMVVACSSDCKKDLTKDGLDLVFKGNTLTAKGTSLGADDGIGVAMIMEALLDRTIKKNIVAIFTIDEETGLDGANELDLNGCNFKITELINLDSEDFGIITLGCASGNHIQVAKKLKFVEVEKSKTSQIQINVSGATGGHSGCDIIHNRANAIKICGHILMELLDKVDINLKYIKGGEFDNSIPTNCSVIFTVNDEDINKTNKAIVKSWNMYQKRFKDTDPNLSLTFGPADPEDILRTRTVISIKDTKDIIKYLKECKSGLIKMHKDFKGVAETSLNLGKIYIENNFLKCVYLTRSAKNAVRENIDRSVIAVAKKYGFKVEHQSSYPAWEYKKDSALEQRAKKVFKQLFKQSAKTEVTHGGLECGIIVNKIKSPIEVISIGPTIKDVHSVKETLMLDTVDKTYEWIKGIINNNEKEEKEN